MNSMHNFNSQKQMAINQLNEMQRRATAPKEMSATDKKPTKKPQKSQENFNKNILSALSDDTLIILGLILILSSDNSDMLLLLALAYILI